MDMGIRSLSLAYTDGMKTILALFVALMFVACSSPETENLKKENSDLKTQLETVTKERDTLKVQLDGIKAVLENAAGSTSITTTPDSSATTPVTPDSGSSPDSSMDSGNSSADSSTPATAPPAPSSTPSSDGTGATSSDSSSSASPKPSSAVETYAKEVLETAQKYNAESQQTPPTDCSSGYTAGTHAVPSSDAVQSCRVDRVDNGFRVTLKDANGAIITLPTP
jgi:hypothetical protein